MPNLQHFRLNIMYEPVVSHIGENRKNAFCGTRHGKYGDTKLCNYLYEQFSYQASRQFIVLVTALSSKSIVQQQIICHSSLQ